MQLHQRQSEFGFESCDAKGCVVELDFLFVVAMRGMVAAEDFQSTVHDSLEDRFAVPRRTQRRIHFEIGVVNGPARLGGFAVLVAENPLAVRTPELLAS